jgi:hypothetical protein
VLYEVEFKWWLEVSQMPDKRFAEFERYKGDEISAQFNHLTSADCDDDCVEKETEVELEDNAAHILDLSLPELHTQNILKYWAAEVATNHFDGACTNRNNYYVAFDGQKYTYIPSGLDQTFMDQTLMVIPFKNNYCPFISVLLEQSNNRARFQSYLRLANGQGERNFSRF